MGISRTAAARLLALLSLFPIVTYADDAGPGKEVGAVRRDLPIILAAQQPVHVTEVRIAGDRAEVRYETTRGPERRVMRRRLDRWWLDCRDPQTNAHIPFSPPRPNDTATVCNRYALTVRMAPNDAPADAMLADVELRAPTEAESWVTPQSDAYAFLSATVRSTAPIDVRAGTELALHFPFALEPSLHYTFSLAFGRREIGPLDAALRANALHVSLPAMRLEPNDELQGEIDGE